MITSIIFDMIKAGSQYSTTASPGDNPVYGVGYRAITNGSPLQTMAVTPVRYTKKVSSNRDRAESVPEREFDNPIYDENETCRNVYADLRDHHYLSSGQSESGAAPDHELNNPIYGAESDETAYPMPPNFSTVPGTEVNVRQKMHS